MKKLAVLALVVGLAAVSFGGLVALPNTSDLWVAPVLDSTTLVIGGNVAPAPGTIWAIGIGYDGSFATIGATNTTTTYAAAGQLGSIHTYPALVPPGFDITVGDGGGTAAQPGFWFTIQCTGYHNYLDEPGPISVWDYAVDPSGNTRVGYINPEPMTLLLLGLGGLMLRKRIQN